MNTEKHIGKDEQEKGRRPTQKEGHEVKSVYIKTRGLAVYVPSVSELRAKPDIIQPFRGQLLGEEFRLRRSVDAGTALARLVERFGLPNAPEYHEWSEDFMHFKREGAYWEYIFQVNAKQYFFVSHDHEEVIVGYKTTPDKETCEAFFRFIESEVDPPLSMESVIKFGFDRARAS